MRAHILTHLSDAQLLRDLDTLFARERHATAAVLAHIAEVDARRLYLPEGFPSMYEYCVRKLHLSEDAASKRIQAARAARRFTAIFSALADGRLHLSAVVLLAPHLTPENADELLAATTGKSKAEITELLAARFPRPELLAWVEDLPVTRPAAPPTDEHAPGHGESPAPAPAASHAPGHVEGHTPRPRVTPIASERFALQVMIGPRTREKLRHAQALLSHRIPSGDLAEVLDRALDALIVRLEKRKFAATERPRRGARRASADPRHIPAHVKRAVWERDHGRCTFVSASGQRCGSRARLEYDHVESVARGGQPTVKGLRLRCRAHNQFEAERMFGAEFMNRKREAARRAAAEARAAATARAAAQQAEARDVIPWLRQLGFRADEARRAAALCESVPDASLEERVRVALSHLSPRARTYGGRRVADGVETVV